jgi:long-chain fatty acid transport protein
MGNFGWQNWSAFGEPELQVSTTSLTINQQYQDTFGVAAGSQIRVLDPLLLSLGFAVDSSAVSTAHRTPAFAVDDQYPWALGLQDDWNDTLTAGIAYELLSLGSAPVNRSARATGTLAGDDSTNLVNFVNFTGSKRF